MEDNSLNTQILFISKWVLEKDAPNGKARKTPTYILQKYLGYSLLLRKRGKGGRIYFYYKPNISTKPDAPPINLQGIGSINFTGLRFLTKDGWKLEESVAYGEACQVPTFNNEKENFMYGHRADAYIFKLVEYTHFDYAKAECICKVPSVIYWIILSEERLRGKQYAKVLLSGLFNELIEELEQRGLLCQNDTKTKDLL